MTELVRFGVSVERSLLTKFDRLIQKEDYSNRSEAFRDLIREKLIKRDWKSDTQDVAGAITLVYDHHQRELINKLIEIQHDCVDVVISTQHIHLDHHNCLEILAVKGKSKDILTLANKLKSIKGVKHGSLSMSSIGNI